MAVPERGAWHTRWPWPRPAISTWRGRNDSGYSIERRQRRRRGIAVQRHQSRGCGGRVHRRARRHGRQTRPGRHCQFVWQGPLRLRWLYVRESRRAGSRAGVRRTPRGHRPAVEGRPGGSRCAEFAGRQLTGGRARHRAGHRHADIGSGELDDDDRHPAECNAGSPTADSEECAASTGADTHGDGGAAGAQRSGRATDCSVARCVDRRRSGPADTGPRGDLPRDIDRRGRPDRFQGNVVHAARAGGSHRLDRRDGGRRLGHAVVAGRGRYRGVSGHGHHARGAGGDLRHAVEKPAADAGIPAMESGLTISAGWGPHGGKRLAVRDDARGADPAPAVPELAKRHGQRERIGSSLPDPM